MLYFEVQCLQILVKRRRSIEYLIAARLYGQFVDVAVVVFEGFTVKRDADGLGFTTSGEKPIAAKRQ